jgi:hypothetical protein
MLDRGSVYRFSYLWAWQHETGEESGRKNRPVCLVLKTSRKTGNLYLFPITTSPPVSGRMAIEVPVSERRLAGLKQSCWLVLDEYNLTSTAATYDFDTLEPMGMFSERFLKDVAAFVKRAILAKQMKAVPRT